MAIVIWKIKSERNPGLGIFLRGPPSDTGIDPEEVNRLYFLSQRKRKRGGTKEGEGKEESWKIQGFTELRNSPESKKRGLVEGGGMSKNWTVANCRNSTFRKSQPSFVEMFKKKKPFLVRKGRLFTSWKEETVCCDGIEQQLLSSVGLQTSGFVLLKKNSTLLCL